MHHYSLRKKAKFFILSFILIICVSLFLVFSISGAQTEEETDPTIKNLTLVPNYVRVKDTKVDTFTTLKQITVKSDTDIDSLYMIFWDKPSNYTLTIGEKTVEVENTFLHSFTKLPEDITECKEIVVSFPDNTNISEISAFKKGNLPENVQIWQQPYDKADLLLSTTHTDDEHLFFAGILPYYSQVKKYRVQVSYFTQFNATPVRNHELLNGLWEVGIDHYPVISEIPDAYSESIDGATANMLRANLPEDYGVKYQTEVIRRFKPLCVVSHDVNGEYGHGQHMFNASTIITAVENASKSDFYPESATQYGVWDTPKLYLHMYNQNVITMDWDTPSDALGGKTPFQVSQLGFKHHISQHNTRFNAWLNGENGEFTKATQIETFSPCSFGLVKSNVGSDNTKNDFFENLTNYTEQERLEQERLEKQEQDRIEKEAEESRKAEESKRLEEKKKQESESLENARLEQAKNNQDQSKHKVIIATIILAGSVIALAVVLLNKFK